MPVAWELVVRARIVEPAAAVMVTEVELVVCQLKVTLWPAPIDAGFAENVSVGTVDVFELVAQEEEPHMARRSVPHEIQRRHCFVMGSCLAP